MNRVEYMTRLAAMLQDIPVEERQEAMKYYNDYFDEAGEENEEKVAAELDSPEKVAAAIKAEIYGRILVKLKPMFILLKNKRNIRTIGLRFS